MLKFIRFEELFRDGLVWTVDLTVEIKLCFQISLAWWGRGLRHNIRELRFRPHYAGKI